MSNTVITVQSIAFLQRIYYNILNMEYYI